MTVHNSAYDLAQLQAIFRDGEEEARLAHVQRLTQQPEDLEERRAVLALLIEVMGDDSWQVRKEAVASTLCWSDKELLAQALVDAMSEPDNIGRRNAVIEGVMKLGPICIDAIVAAPALRWRGGRRRWGRRRSFIYPPSIARLRIRPCTGCTT